MKLRDTYNLAWSRSESGVEYFVHHCKPCYMMQWARWLYQHNYAKYETLHGEDTSQWPISEDMAAKPYTVRKDAKQFKYPVEWSRDW